MADVYKKNNIMTSTLDGINNNINIKFDKLKNIIELYLLYEIDQGDDNMLQMYLNELNNLKELFVTSTIDTVKDYYCCVDDNKKKEIDYEKNLKIILDNQMEKSVDNFYRLIILSIKLIK